MVERQRPAASRWLIDLVSGAARAAAIARLDGGNGTIAEIGTGTGAFLGRYPSRLRVIGIDRALGPLRIAAARRRRRSLDHVMGLACADLRNLPLAEASLDGAVVLFRLFERADPDAALRELARVVRPGGHIVILDLMAHAEGWRARAERGLTLLGLAPGGGWSGNVAGLVEGMAMTLTAVRRVAPFGLFTVVCLRTEQVAAEAGPGGLDQDAPVVERTARRAGRRPRQRARAGRPATRGHRRRRLTG